MHLEAQVGTLPKDVGQLASESGCCRSITGAQVALYPASAPPAQADQSLTMLLELFPGKTTRHLHLALRIGLKVR
jgi:hypothetical protein